MVNQGVWIYFQYSVNKKYAHQFNREVVHKWTLAFFLFTTFFWAFKLTTGSGSDVFDPSGHLSAGLISMNCHYSAYRFCSTKIKELDRVKLKTTEIQAEY